MRGLEEKIWKASQPSEAAFSAAPASDPAIDVWMPMRGISGQCSIAGRGV